MNKQKWYNKTWFMWLMLIICWPIGIIFLYRHRDDYTVKKIAYIAGGTLCIYILLTSFSTMNQPKQSEQTTTASTTTSTKKGTRPVLSKLNPQLCEAICGSYRCDAKRTINRPKYKRFLVDGTGYRTHRGKRNI